MAISLFEAFDLKHDYLMKKLKGYALPSSTALYIDTEIVESSEGSQPRNVHEWTILSHSQGKQVCSMGLVSSINLPS